MLCRQKLMAKAYVLEERFNDKGEPQLKGYRSSFACTCSAEDLEMYQNETVRLWNEIQETDFKTFQEWNAAIGYQAIHSLFYYLDFEHGYAITSMAHDMWCALTAVGGEGEPSYYIQYDDLLFGLVDLINFLRN